MDQPVFSTCDLCDANKDDRSGAFRVLPSVFIEYGARKPFSGQVLTLRALEDNSIVRATVSTPGAGRILVIDGGSSMRRALVGGNLSSMAAANGWQAILIDGCVRDVGELAACGIPVRALGLCPMRPEKQGHGTSGEPVRIQGVWVRPGDWIYGDADGVVICDRSLL